MADNVAITAGTGTSIATDDVVGVHFQQVKLVDGAADSSARIGGDAANGLDVDVTRVGGNVTVVQATATNLKVDASGVAVPVTDNGASLTVDGSGTFLGRANDGTNSETTLFDLDTGVGNQYVRGVSVRKAAAAGSVEYGSSTDPLRVDPTGTTVQPVSATSLPLPTGASTAALQLPNSHDVTVDNASGASAVNIQDGGNSVTVDQATAASLNAQVVGAVAHDAAASGNPLLNAGSHETMADTAPSNRLATITDGDVQRLSTTDGALFVIPTGPQTWSYHENSSSALTDTAVHAAPAAGLSLYVTDIVVSTGAATAFNVFFEEGVTTVLGPYYLEAVAGRGLGIHFGTPKKITAATALTVTTSVAIAHSIDVTGFIAPG